MDEMTIWQFLDGIIRHPPLILVAIVIAILAAHALRIALEFISNRKHPNSLIITLEIIVVIVLAYVVIHLYAEKLIGAEPTKSQYEPFLMACLLVFFTIISTLVYFFFRIAIQARDQE